MTPEKKLKCDRCGKSFKNDPGLKIHYGKSKDCNPIPMPEKKFNCDNCVKSFTTYKGLTTHYGMSKDCNSIPTPESNPREQFQVGTKCGKCWVKCGKCLAKWGKMWQFWAKWGIMG